MNTVDEIPTSTIGVKLPTPMKAYLEAQAAKAGCTDLSEFVVSVLEDHQYRQQKSEIEAMLLETVNGPFTEWTDQTIEEIRREGIAIIDRRKGK